MFITQSYQPQYRHHSRGSNYRTSVHVHASELSGTHFELKISHGVMLAQLLGQLIRREIIRLSPAAQLFAARPLDKCQAKEKTEAIFRY